MQRLHLAPLLLYAWYGHWRTLC